MSAIPLTGKIKYLANSGVKIFTHSLAQETNNLLCLHYIRFHPNLLNASTRITTLQMKYTLPGDAVASCPVRFVSPLSLSPIGQKAFLLTAPHFGRGTFS